MSRLLSRPVCLFLLGAAFGAGCKPSVSVTPVSGKVTLNGQPVASGQVSLLPLEEKPGAELSAGQIDSSGEYKIYTAGKEGAPLGQYKVTVTPSMMPMGGTKAPPRPFPAKYSDTKDTPLRIEVVSSPAPGAYDLKMTR